MSNVGAVVLAAGRSSRYRAAGGAEATKLVAELGGRAIVRRVVEAALASRARPVVVVVGHAREAVEAALLGLPVAVAFNPDFAAGVASSLGAGLRALPPDADGALVLLGDMPNVGAALLDRLIGAFNAAAGAAAVAPVVAGRRGNPVLLARTLFAQAMRLEGDEGARRLLAGLAPGRVTEIETVGADAAFDVDTPEDLAASRARD
ncbi:molybdenum cofactor cytidylyltransferase [Roseiarcus fermentans]|uniref:Molybdenum cofactor cytidylyltransferase n=1 Tax=Roseiarcus fermentans TaxID=1473586 RepID=A0A366FCB0_9HYPH|nr:nucleotidyltransferase family protein [Roseiarcus fermentans]RBP11399.1 molybdenum cofactor cytidylyltransferase [Roseiarcus fermentans]